MPNREAIWLRFDTRMSADDSEAEIMVYGEICSDDWKWAQSDVSAVDFDKALKQAKGKKRVNLRINSPGGEVFQAVAMRAMLLGSGIEDLHIYIEGLCASAATLLTCVPGAKVHIAEGSEYMIHNPWTIAWGESKDFEGVAERLRKMEGDMQAIYAKQTGQTVEQIAQWMDAETWLTATEAVKHGFATDATEAEPVAASISPRVMALMRDMYKNVPDTLRVAEEKTKVRNEAPTVAAGISSEHKTNKEEKPSMDIKDITLEQLRAENTALVDSIAQESIAAERQRIQDIDDLTPAGYEQMAAEAKTNGTSAMDFHKAVVKAQREKGPAFLAARKNETKPAMSVPGGASEDAVRGTEQALNDAAKEIADFAKAARATADGGMY